MIGTDVRATTLPSAKQQKNQLKQALGKKNKKIRAVSNDPKDIAAGKKITV
jgi:hypothetical protein